MKLAALKTGALFKEVLEYDPPREVLVRTSSVEPIELGGTNEVVLAAD